MKVCIAAKIYDVQNTKEHGFVVLRGGKVITRGTDRYEMAVSEFKRLAEDQTYAARERAVRTAGG